MYMQLSPKPKNKKEKKSRRKNARKVRKSEGTVEESIGET